MAEPVPADDPAVFDATHHENQTGPTAKRFGRRQLTALPPEPPRLPLSPGERPDPLHGTNGLSHAGSSPNGSTFDGHQPGSTSLLAVVSTHFASLFGEFIAPLMQQFRAVERECGRLEAELAAATAARDDARAEVVLLREILRATRPGGGTTGRDGAA